MARKKDEPLIPEPIPVTIPRAVVIFEVTEKTVRSWIRAGLPVLKAGAKGSGNGALVDLAELIPWYLEENALDVAKTRLASAQAEKFEAENALRRAEVASIADVARFVSEHNQAARAKLLSIPAKLSPQLKDIHDPNVIAAGIRAEISAALAELAEWPVQAGPAESEKAARGRKSVAATADPHSEPMGRRVSKVKPRK